MMHDLMAIFFTVSVDASRAGAGNLEIIVSAGSENVPNFVKAEGNAKFEVSFTPQVAETHMISVKFNGDAVPGMDSSGLLLASGTIDGLLFESLSTTGKIGQCRQVFGMECMRIGLFYQRRGEKGCAGKCMHK